MHEPDYYQPHFPHDPEESDRVIREFQARANQHVDIPDDVAEDVQIKITILGGIENIRWLIDEAAGDVPLLSLLVDREMFFQSPGGMRDTKDDVYELYNTIRHRKRLLGLIPDNGEQ